MRILEHRRVAVIQLQQLGMSERRRTPAYYGHSSFPLRHGDLRGSDRLGQTTTITPRSPRSTTTRFNVVTTEDPVEDVFRDHRSRSTSRRSDLRRRATFVLRQDPRDPGR